MPLISIPGGKPTAQQYANILRVSRRFPSQNGLRMRELVTNFATWTATTGGSSTISLTDSDHYGSGTSCARLTSDGANGDCYISSPVLTDTIDLMNNGILMLAIKTDNAALLTSTPYTIYAGSDASGYTNYLKWNPYEPAGASVIRYNTPDGVWTMLMLHPVIAQTTGSPVLTAITQLRIKITSTSGTPTDVRFGAVLLAKNSFATYPNGAVSITFDDARSGQGTYAFPMLGQRRIKGTFYLVDDYVGSDSNNYMTMAQVAAIRADGHTIGYHSSAVAAHSNRYPGIGAAAAAADLQRSFVTHLANGWEDPGDPRHFAWPGGEWDADTFSAVSALGLQSMRLTGGSATQMETFPPVDKLKIVSASSTGVLTTLALKKAWFDVVKAQKAWGVLAEHQIFASATSASGTNWKDFEALLDYGISIGLSFPSISDVTE